MKAAGITYTNELHAQFLKVKININLSWLPILKAFQKTIKIIGLCYDIRVYKCYGYLIG